MEASSSSLQIETRLGLIQQDMDEVKEALNRLEVKQTRMQKIGTSHWESMTQELKEIHEEIFEDNMTNMKDIANILWGIGNQMVELEKKVEELLKEHGKTPKIERWGRPVAKRSRILSFQLSFFPCKIGSLYFVCVIMDFPISV